MNSDSQKIQPRQFLYRWRQTISVCWTELKRQTAASAVLVLAAVFLTTWFLVPSGNVYSLSVVVSALVIGSIWLLLMSHMSFSEQIQRPLNFTASLPVPYWQLWLSRILVITLIQIMVTGVLIGASYVWIKLVHPADHADRAIQNTARTIGIFALWLTAVFHAWSITRQGYLWLIVLSTIVLVLIGYDPKTERIYFSTSYHPAMLPSFAASLVLSYLGFVNRIKGIKLMRSRAKTAGKTRGWRLWLIRGGALAGAILGLMALIGTNSSYTSVHRTENLEFACSEEDVASIQPLIDSGETHFTIVSDFLGPVETNGRFNVILTEVFDGTGYGGIANWNMIRLGRDALDHQNIFPADEIFRHELAHVFLKQLSDGKLIRHFDAMQVFHEGVATYCQSLPDTETMTRDQTHSILKALTREQWDKEISFSDILDGKGDPYGHGLLLAKALAKEFGPDSFRRMAIEVKELETKAIFYKGEAFWYLLCNRLGFSIELLEMRYLNLKDKFAKTHQEVLSLPQPNPKVSWGIDGSIVFRQQQNPAHDATLAIFVTTGEDLLSRYEKPLVADENGQIKLSAETLQKLAEASWDETVRYTPGWIHTSLHLPLYHEAKDLPEFPLKQNDGHELLTEAKLIKFSSEHSENRKAAFAFDHSPNTFWHTSWGNNTAKHPHELVIDLGETREITGFQYLARQDSGWNGSFKECEFYTGDEPATIETLAVKTRFKKTKNFQSAKCNTPVRGRYVLVRVLSEINDGPWASAAEIIIEAKGKQGSVAVGL